MGGKRLKNSRKAPASNRVEDGTNTQGCPLTSVHACPQPHPHTLIFMVVLLMDILSAKYYCSHSLKNRRMFVNIHNPPFLLLGIKPRVLYMLGKHSTTEVHPQLSSSLFSGHLFITFRQGLI